MTRKTSHCYPFSFSIAASANTERGFLFRPMGDMSIEEFLNARVAAGERAQLSHLTVAFQTRVTNAASLCKCSWMVEAGLLVTPESLWSNANAEVTGSGGAFCDITTLVNLKLADDNWSWDQLLTCGPNNVDIKAADGITYHGINGKVTVKPTREQLEPRKILFSDESLDVPGLRSSVVIAIHTMEDLAATDIVGVAGYIDIRYNVTQVFNLNLVSLLKEEPS